MLEIDGNNHGPNFLEDAERQGKMEKYGLHFLRFSNEEVLNNLEFVLSVIRDYVKENT